MTAIVAQNFFILTSYYEITKSKVQLGFYLYDRRSLKQKQELQFSRGNFDLYCIHRMVCTPVGKNCTIVVAYSVLNSILLLAVRGNSEMMILDFSEIGSDDIYSAEFIKKNELLCCHSGYVFRIEIKY